MKPVWGQDKVRQDKVWQGTGDQGSVARLRESLPGIVPDWPAPARVGAFVTTRLGGCSAGPYGDASGGAVGLNLGEHVGDDPAHVAANRARLQALLPAPICWMEQVHGVTVYEADRLNGAAGVPRADAAVTSTPGAVLSIMTADCLPILLTDEQGAAIACAHAGWRGLASGVIEASVTALRSRLGAEARLMAWLGPAIGPRAFEVGDEVRAAFGDQDADALSAFAPGPIAGKWWADLYALAHRRLQACGVEQVSGGVCCTVSDPQRFYSHRRDRVSGRMVSLLWIDP